MHENQKELNQILKDSPDRENPSPLLYGDLVAASIECEDQAKSIPDAFAADWLANKIGLRYVRTDA